MLDKSFFIETYGCQMNKADSTSLRMMLIDKGFDEAEDVSSARVIIVNTCAVRENAEKRVYGRLNYFNKLREKAKRTIVLTGCLARFSYDKIKNLGVDIVADVYSQEDIVSALLNEKDLGIFEYFRDEGYQFKRSYADERVPFKAFVSITHGCDNWCAYCIVPKVRGPMLSRPSKNILEDILRLASEGVSEITLLGQNVNSYGEDNADLSFVSLLSEIEEMLQKNSLSIRLRFLTSHPKDFSKDLARALVDFPSLCEHLHLPFQSGNDRVLKKMNRKYSRNDYLSKVAYLRSLDPNFALSTDVIVGFDLETENEFEDTLSLMQEVRFEDAYMYRYSEREGSRAHTLGIPYNEEESLKRLSYLIEKQREMSKETLSRFVGSVCEVLVEQEAKDKEHYLGRSRENRMVLIPKEGVRLGDVVKVRTTFLKGIVFLSEIL